MIRHLLAIILEHMLPEPVKRDAAQVASRNNPVRINVVEEQRNPASGDLSDRLSLHCTPSRNLLVFLFRTENGFPNLSEFQFADPSCQVVHVEQCATVTPNSRNVAEMLGGRTFLIVDHLSKNYVFRLGHACHDIRDDVSPHTPR